MARTLSKAAALQSSSIGHRASNDNTDASYAPPVGIQCSSSSSGTSTSHSCSSSGRPSPVHLVTALPPSSSGNSILSTSSTQHTNVFSSPILLAREFSTTSSSSASSHTSLDQDSLSSLLLNNSSSVRGDKARHMSRSRIHPAHSAEESSHASPSAPPRTPSPSRMRRSLPDPITPLPDAAYTQNPYLHHRKVALGSLSEHKRRLVCRPTLGGRFSTPPVAPELRELLPQLDWPDDIHGPWAAASERMLLERRQRAAHFHRWIEKDDYSDIEDEYAAAELLEPELNAYLAAAGAADAPGTSSQALPSSIDPAIQELELRRREETLADDLYHPMVAKALRDRMRKDAEAKAALLAGLQRQTGQALSGGRLARGRGARRQGGVDHYEQGSSTHGTSPAFATPSKRGEHSTAAKAQAAAGALVSPTKRRRKNAAELGGLPFPTTAPAGGRREKKAGAQHRKRAVSGVAGDASHSAGPLSLSAFELEATSDATTSAATTPVAFNQHSSLHPYPGAQSQVVLPQARAPPSNQCPCGHAQPPSFSAFVHEPASPSHGRGSKARKNRASAKSNGGKDRAGDDDATEPRSEAGPDVSKGSLEDDDEEPEAAMVLCDACNVWHHLACVGIASVDELGDEWFCEPCCRSALAMGNHDASSHPSAYGPSSSMAGATIAPSSTVASSGGSTFMSTPSFLRTLSAQGQIALLSSAASSLSNNSATAARVNPFLRGQPAASGGSMLSAGPTLGMGLNLLRTPVVGASGGYGDPSSSPSSRMLASSSSVTLVPSSSVSGMRSMNKMLAMSPLGLGFGSGFGELRPGTLGGNGGGAASMLGPPSPTAMLSRARAGRTSRQQQQRSAHAEEPTSPLERKSALPALGENGGSARTQRGRNLAAYRRDGHGMLGSDDEFATAADGWDEDGDETQSARQRGGRRSSELRTRSGRGAGATTPPPLGSVPTSALRSSGGSGSRGQRRGSGRVSTGRRVANFRHGFSSEEEDDLDAVAAAVISAAEAGAARTPSRMSGRKSGGDMGPPPPLDLDDVFSTPSRLHTGATWGGAGRSELGGGGGSSERRRLASLNGSLGLPFGAQTPSRLTTPHLGSHPHSQPQHSRHAHHDTDGPGGSGSPGRIGRLPMGLRTPSRDWDATARMHGGYPYGSSITGTPSAYTSSELPSLIFSSAGLDMLGGGLGGAGAGGGGIGSSAWPPGSPTVSTRGARRAQLKAAAASAAAAAAALHDEHGDVAQLEGYRKLGAAGEGGAHAGLGLGFDFDDVLDLV